MGNLVDAVAHQCPAPPCYLIDLPRYVIQLIDEHLDARSSMRLAMTCSVMWRCYAGMAREDHRPIDDILRSDRPFTAMWREKSCQDVAVGHRMQSAELAVMLADVGWRNGFIRRHLDVPIMYAAFGRNARSHAYPRGTLGDLAHRGVIAWRSASLTDVDELLCDYHETIGGWNGNAAAPASPDDVAEVYLNYTDGDWCYSLGSFMTTTMTKRHFEIRVRHMIAVLNHPTVIRELRTFDLTRRGGIVEWMFGVTYGEIRTGPPNESMITLLEAFIRSLDRAGRIDEIGELFVLTAPSAESASTCMAPAEALFDASTLIRLIGAGTPSARGNGDAGTVELFYRLWTDPTWAVRLFRKLVGVYRGVSATDGPSTLRWAMDSTLTARHRKRLSDYP